MARRAAFNGSLSRCWPRVVFGLVALFYVWGAFVHILNMASLTGFDWPEAPLKWQGLDIIYLVLDLVVVVGLIRGSWVGVAAFFAAAISQIGLYTLGRDWVLDVPPAFRRSAEDLAYLDGLVAFHVLTCLAMGVATLALLATDGKRQGSSGIRRATKPLTGRRHHASTGARRA